MVPYYFNYLYYVLVPFQQFPAITLPQFAPASSEQLQAPALPQHYNSFTHSDTNCSSRYNFLITLLPFPQTQLSTPPTPNVLTVLSFCFDVITRYRRFRRCFIQRHKPRNEGHRIHRCLRLSCGDVQGMSLRVNAVSYRNIMFPQ